MLAPQFTKSAGPLAYLANNNRLALLFTARSGDIFNIGSNRQPNGDALVPSAMQRPLYIGRNTYRGQPVYQVDARYSRVFPIGERIKPEFLLEAWNLFNHSNVTGYNTTATVDTLGRLLSMPSFAQNAALDPRLLQVGVRVSW